MTQQTIDVSGRRGLAPRFSGDVDRSVTGGAQPNLRIIASDGQMVDGYYNPFKRYGYLSGANTLFTDITPTTAWTGLLNCSVYDEVNNDLIVGSNGRYIQVLADNLDDLTFTLDASAGDLGTVGSPTIKDLCVYQINGVRRGFAVYEASDAVNIGHFPLPYGSGAFVPGMFSATGGGTVSFLRNAFMRVADNGFAYLFVDNTVHRIDGTILTGGASGTTYPNVLVFPINFTIADAVDYKGYFFIGVNQSAVAPSVSASSDSAYTSPCGVYIWNRQSGSLSNADYAPIIGVRAITRIYITQEGKVRAMVTNAEGFNEIREYNGTTFIPLTETGRNSHPNVLHSLTIQGGVAIWVARNGDIMAHGKIYPGEPDGLYKIGTLPETTSQTGFVFFGGSNTYSGVTGYKPNRSGLIIGYTDNSANHKCKQWDMYGTGSASSTSGTFLSGDVYTRVYQLPVMSQLKKITFYLAPGTLTGSTSTGTIGVYLNSSTTPLMTKTVTRDDKKRGYIQIEINKSYVNSVQFKFSFPVGAASNLDTDMAPSTAVLEYLPTGDKG